MSTSSTLGRRRFLTGVAALIAAPAIESLVVAGRANASIATGTAGTATAADPMAPFVAHYESGPALRVGGLARIEENCSLRIDLGACDVRRGSRTFRVISADDLRGVFRSVSVSVPGHYAEPRYGANGLSVRIHSTH